MLKKTNFNLLLWKWSQRITNSRTTQVCAECKASLSSLMRVGHKNKTNGPTDNKQRNKTAHTEIWGRLMWCRSQGEAMLGSTYLLRIVTPNLPEVIRPRFLKKKDAREETQLSVKHWFQQEIELFVVFFSCHVHSLMCFILHRFTQIY